MWLLSNFYQQFFEPKNLQDRYRQELKDFEDSCRRTIQNLQNHYRQSLQNRYPQGPQNKKDHQDLRNRAREHAQELQDFENYKSEKLADIKEVQFMRSAAAILNVKTNEIRRQWNFESHKVRFSKKTNEALTFLAVGNNNTPSLLLEAAFEQIRGLNEHQLKALIAHYHHGLRGAHLRTWKGCYNIEPFDYDHASTLSVLLDAGISPESAMTEISKKSPTEISTLRQDAEKQIAIKQTAEALAHYGATIEALQAKWPSTLNSGLIKQLLIFLVSGRHPNYENERVTFKCEYHDELDKPLLINEALEEIRDLTHLQLNTLSLLFIFGLRGKHLRDWKGEAESDRFLDSHTDMLIKLIKMGTTPAAAMALIQKKSIKEINSIISAFEEKLGLKTSQTINPVNEEIILEKGQQAFAILGQTTWYTRKDYVRLRRHINISQKTYHGVDYMTRLMKKMYKANQLDKDSFDFFVWQAIPTKEKIIKETGEERLVSVDTLTKIKQFMSDILGDIDIFNTTTTHRKDPMFVLHQSIELCEFIPDNPMLAHSLVEHTIVLTCFVNPLLELASTFKKGDVSMQEIITYFSQLNEILVKPTASKDVEAKNIFLVSSTNYRCLNKCKQWLERAIRISDNLGKNFSFENLNEKIEKEETTESKEQNESDLKKCRAKLFKDGPSSSRENSSHTPGLINHNG